MPKPSAKSIAFVLRTIVGIVVLLAAVGISAYLVATKPQVSTSGLEKQSIRVQVIRVQPVDVPRQWRGYGTTRPIKNGSVDVPARIGATVIEVPEGIEVGRVVKKGDILAKLDTTDFKNTFDAAEKRITEVNAAIKQLAVEKQRLAERLELEQKKLALAQADYKRQLDRIDSGSTTQSDIERSETSVINAEQAALATRQQIDLIPTRLAGLEAQQAAVTSDRDTAKANLDRATIKSEIDGIIESIHIEVGENLTPGAMVARIVDPRKLEVPIQLPATASAFVTTGDTLILTTRNQADDCPPWTAKITRLGAADGPTRTFTVYAEVDQSTTPLRNFAEGGGPHKLRIGAFVLAKLDTSDATPRIILPDRAIQEGRVRTIIDGKVVGKDVTFDFDLEGTFPQFGVADTQWVALKESLKPGELIVLSASMSILDGQPVEAVVSNDQTKADDNDATGQESDSEANP